MQYVSIRSFQLHAKKFLPGLPLVLTRYNIPVAKIIKYSNSPQEETTMPTAGIKKEIDRDLTKHISLYTSTNKKLEVLNEKM